ncbi:MAG: hypothetical protein O7E51_11290 [Acidobacteria bacterium]|nr:hypothetical protein [Acidobacteriota bacterium]
MVPIFVDTFLPARISFAELAEETTGECQGRLPKEIGACLWTLKLEFGRGSANGKAGLAGKTGTVTPQNGQNETQRGHGDRSLI